MLSLRGLGFEAIPRAVVLGSTVDETKSFTVKVLGAPKGEIAMLIVLDYSTGKDYDILAGEQAYCYPGADNLGINVGVRNAGVLRGRIYLKITDDQGVQLAYEEWTLDPGVGISFGIRKDMPPRDYGITVEVGHL